MAEDFYGQAPLASGAADGDVATWSAARRRYEPGAGGGGGGASTPPGQAAHYIGTWDIAVAYAAGECVRQWDGAEFKLYQAKKATTGDDPTSVVASWAEVTTPIVMWGTENPLNTGWGETHDTANPPIGVRAPDGSVYLWQGSAGGGFGGAVLIYNDDQATWVASGDQAFTVPSGQSGLVVNDAPYVNIDGLGGGTASTTAAAKNGAATGSCDAGGVAYRYGSGTGNALAWVVARLFDTAVGTATAGAKAVHHAGGEAHVLPTADASGARNDVKGDLIFTDNTEGPVIHDQSDGHTYRIVSTAGVLSTVQVT